MSGGRAGVVETGRGTGGVPGRGGSDGGEIGRVEGERAVVVTCDCMPQRVGEAGEMGASAAAGVLSDL